MTIHSVLFAGDRREASVELDRRLVRSLGADRLLWVDVVGDTGQVDDVATVLQMPAALLRRVGSMERPALQRHQGWVRLTVHSVPEPPAGSPTDEPLTTAPIEILAGKNVVVTAHAAAQPAIDTLADQLGDEPGLGVLDAAAVVAAVVDEVLAIYLRHVEAIERRVDVLDELAIRGRSAGAYLTEVVALRRRIAALRRALAPHREAFGPLARPDFEIAALGRPWPGLVERLEATMHAIQGVRELLIGSVELQQSSTAERANDVMKRLTLVNAILLPAVVLAGVMGMNFPLPFFQEPLHFWLIVGAMAGLATAIMVAARMRGWF